MQLDEGKITIQRLLEQLGIRKLCRRFVLKAEKIERWFNAYKRNLTLFDLFGPNILCDIVTKNRDTIEPIYIFCTQGVNQRSE